MPEKTQQRPKRRLEGPKGLEEARQSGGAKLVRAARSRAELGRAGPRRAGPGRPGWPGRVGQAKHKESLCAPPPTTPSLFLGGLITELDSFWGGLGGSVGAVRGGVFQLRCCNQNMSHMRISKPPARRKVGGFWAVGISYSALSSVSILCAR